MTDERNIWADDPANFEQLRQNFTTSLFVSGPNMTLPEMSERLCEMRDRIEALSGLILDLAELVEDCLEDGGEFSTEWDIKARDTLTRAKELSI